MVRLLAPALLLTALAAPAVAAPKTAPQRESTQFNCDALTTNVKLDDATQRDLIPAHSLDAAAAVLTRHNVPFHHSQGIMTLNDVPDKVVEKINLLPQGEPVILPNGEGSAICVLRPSADSI